MTVVVVMGVTGSGKTTIGRMLAQHMSALFAEGDDYHPPANVEKMRRGQPLTDDDRRPWLAAIAADIRRWLAEGRPAVVACSALKRAYRDVLRGPGGDIRFVHLIGSPQLIHARMAARRNHYMPVSLLQSQLDTLEPPVEGEGALAVGIDGTPEEIFARVLDGLGLGPADAVT